jgi:NADPH:quinone reductase
MPDPTIPQQTIRVVATAYGGPEVLETETTAVPAPGPGQVVLEVRASGVNPIDWKLYSGMMGDDPAKLPMPIGLEASGVVIAVGANAAGAAGPVKVGDQVIGFPIAGAAAEHVLADAEALVPKPAALSFEEAGGLLLTGGTAIHTLEATAVGAEDTVLLHGGSGGVGLTAIQAAIARGANVVATASEPRHEALRALGATPIAYGSGLLERARAAAPEGYDAAIDTAGTSEALAVSLELVADRARIATIVPRDEARDAGIKVLGGGPGADPGTEIRNAARLQLTELVERGALHMPVTSRPLAEIADAHRDSMSGHSYGKVVLVP